MLCVRNDAETARRRQPARQESAQPARPKESEALEIPQPRTNAHPAAGAPETEQPQERFEEKCAAVFRSEPRPKSKTDSPRISRRGRNRQARAARRFPSSAPGRGSRGRRPPAPARECGRSGADRWCSARPRPRAPLARRHTAQKALSTNSVSAAKVSHALLVLEGRADPVPDAEKDGPGDMRQRGDRAADEREFRQRRRQALALQMLAGHQLEMLRLDGEAQIVIGLRPSGNQRRIGPALGRRDVVERDPAARTGRRRRRRPAAPVRGARAFPW